MKKYITITTLLLVVAGVAFAGTDYWPYVTNDYPVNLGSSFGRNAYVVGDTSAALSNSIAIAGNQAVGYVLDAKYACQIGSGSNTNDYTIQFNSNVLCQVHIDTSTVTTTTLYRANSAGEMLFGNYGVGTNGAWVSTGAGTNNWDLIAPMSLASGLDQNDSITVSNCTVKGDIIPDGGLIDASGAVDMDYGSADITDHTFTTDSGAVILDGAITQDAGTTFVAGGTIDPAGAVDLDFGSADITDHTFTSDGGTTIIDGDVTAAGKDLGSTSAEWNDLYLNDGGVVQLGNDQDVTITHVADSGVLFELDDYISFGDSAVFIESDDDSYLDLDADGGIRANATLFMDGGLLDATGAVDMDIGSGDITDVTVITDGGSIVLDGDITQDAGTTLAMGGTLDATGAVDMDYGSGDITDHTFTTDSTGDNEIVLPASSVGPAEMVYGLEATGTKTTYGIPYCVTFKPTAAETLSYTVPSAFDLVVQTISGFKAAGAGAHADDEADIKNDGTQICTAEMNTISDGAELVFTAWDDAAAVMEVEGGTALTCVTTENAGNGCDAVITVVGILKTAD